MIRKLAFIITVLFVFSLPWEENLTIGSLGTFNRVIGLLASAIWVLSVFITGRLRKIHPFHIAIILFIMWNLATMIWTVNSDITKQRIQTYAQLALLSYLLWDQVTNSVQIRVLLQSYVLGCYVSIGGTIVNFLAGKEAFPYSGGRYVATGFNANDLAILLAMGLPIAWYLLQNPLFKSRWKNLFAVNLIFIPSVLFAIFLTGSRAGFLTILVAVLYIFFSIGQIKWWKKAIALCIVLISFLIVFHYVPQSTIQRLSTTFSSIETGDLGGRGAIYRDALKIIDSDPILGVGSGAFVTASTVKTFAHNTIISVLTETGAIGLFLFIVILSVAFYEATEMPFAQSRFWIAMLLLWALGSSSVSWEFRKPTWFLLTMLIITAVVTRQERSKAPQKEVIKAVQSQWATLNE